MFPSFWWDAAAHQPEVTALAAAAACVNHWEFVPNPRALLLVHQMGSLELSAATCLFLLTDFVQLRGSCDVVPSSHSSWCAVSPLR